LPYPTGTGNRFADRGRFSNDYIEYYLSNGGPNENSASAVNRLVRTGGGMTIYRVQARF